MNVLGINDMQGLRWILLWLRDPAAAMEQGYAAVDERLAPLEAHFRSTLKEWVRTAALVAGLATAAAALLLVGAIYLCIGTWLSAAALLGPIGASFVLAALFAALGAAAIAIARRMLR